MGNILRFFGGVLLTALIVTVTLARLAVELVGASTTPDDFALLKQRMPTVLSWLFSTPWWAPTILLFAASAAAAWLIWSGTKRAAAHEMEEHDALDEQAISAMIQSHLAQWPQLEQRTDMATHADLHAHDEKLAELSGRIDSVRMMVEGSHNSASARLNAIEERLEKLVTYAEQRTGDLSERFASVDLGFAALHNREWHERLFRELGEAYEELAIPVRAGNGITSADNWQRGATAWRAKLHQWLGIADYYAMQAEQKILKVPDFVYEREWPLNEAALTANQVRVYKEMTTIWQNAQEEKPRIDKCFDMAAFHSPSKKGRMESPPRPTEGQ